MPAKVGYLVIDAEIEKLGGRWLEPGKTRELEGFRWRCMADREATSSTSTSCPRGHSRFLGGTDGPSMAARLVRTTTRLEGRWRGNWPIRGDVPAVQPG